MAPTIEVCAVQLPGRGERLGEAPYKSLPALIETVAAVIAQQDARPFAFFGHSLGGLLAFEVARYCQRSDLTQPIHIFASGCDAPQHRSVSRRLHKLGDDALIAALKEYDGAPSSVFENTELMALTLPAIRSDFALAENYHYRPGPPLDMPITVLAGKLEKISAEQVEGWQKETTGACRIRWFDGGHFFIHSDRTAVLECLKTELAEVQCT